MKVNVSKGAYIAPKVSVRQLSTEAPIAGSGGSAESNPNSLDMKVNNTPTRNDPAAKGCNIWE